MFLRGESLQSGRGGGWKKLVAIDARGNAFAAIMRLDSDDLREAADMHIAGQGNLARQS
jgi:hypothetical protein